MHHKNKRFWQSRNFLDKLVLIIFLFGPAIDIITSAMPSNILITPGIIIRTIFIFYAIYYLIFIDKTRQRLNIILLSCLAIIIAAVLFMNVDQITNFNFKFFNYTSKFIFLCIGLIYFMSWSASQKSFNSYLFRLPFLIIIISYALSIITGTAYSTYSTWGDGHSGWISSANEFSALLCCIFPFSLYNAFKNDPSKKIPLKILDLVIVIALSAIMLAIGTKASLFGYLIATIAYFVYRLITIKANHFPLTLLLFPILFLATALLWHHLPAITNTNNRIDKIEFTNAKIQSNLSKTTDPTSPDPSDNTPTLKNPTSSEAASINSTTQDIIWNGRDDFEETLKELRENDTNTNKVAIFLFGKFYSSDRKSVAIIERDLHDIFNLFGLLGFIFVLVLITPSILLSVIHFFATLKSPANQFNFITLLSVGITLGAAFICGHTLLSPSVSSFLMISFALLLKNPATKKRTVTFIASAGGHLTQIMTLSPIFKNYHSCLITEKTPIKLKTNIPVKYVLYCSRKQPVSYFFKSIANTCRSFYLFAVINPDVIITTGTHTAIPTCIFGWLFRRKVIYIESFAKNSSPTMTGRLIYPFTDAFIVQWKNMQKFYPKAKYFGGIY